MANILMEQNVCHTFLCSNSQISNLYKVFVNVLAQKMLLIYMNTTLGGKKLQISMPVSDSLIKELKVNDTVEITGIIYCGRDAVLPKIAELLKNGEWSEMGIDLNGSAIFHTAVSPAGIGPTSSNKVDIESSIPELSKAGIKFHIGKGSLSKESVEALKKYNSIFLVTPPNTALLTSKITKKEIAAFEDEGMEAFSRIEVVNFPAIVAIAHGESIFDK